jgi:prepilin-type N-terminal cleavage/methylation domain-containing protein
MLNRGSKKSGYTLVEVLVVVSIMGILSGLGVAGLRGAVINSRMKDCALNTTAFLERMANEANRISKRLCIVADNDQRLTAYINDDCTDMSAAEVFDSFVLEAPAKFGCDNQITIDYDGGDWSQDGAVFVPRIGLSAAPAEGYVCMQYGSSTVYAMAHKMKNNNMIIPKWRAGSVWNKL